VTEPATTPTQEPSGQEPTRQEPIGPDHSDLTGHPYRWAILGVMLAAEIMDLLDATVVNVAGPSLERDLGTSPTQLQWVIGGYALALGAGLILGGRLGDRFGRRATFLLGLGAFTAASLLCSLAPTVEALIAFRLLQGAAGAVLLPQGFGLIRAAFPPRELGKAFAVFGPVFGLAGIVGPIIGGGLVQADLFGTGWRLIFIVNLPIGLVALAIAAALLPRTPGDRALRIDLTGAALVAGSSGLLVLPLIQGQAAGWPVWTWISLAAAAVGFALFAVQQRRSAGRGGTPLVDPRIFAKRAYLTGLGGIALFFAGLTGAQLVLTLFLQLGRHYSAGQAGLAGIPLAVGSGIGGAISGAALADRLGRTVLQVGTGVQVVGGALLWAALTLTDGFAFWYLVPGMTLLGLGSGMVVAALFNVVLGTVEDDQVGSASGVLSAVQSVAASVGVAVFGSVFFHFFLQGDPRAGLRNALVVLAVLLAGFLLVSPLFPRRARPDEHARPAGEPEPEPVH